MIKNFQVYRSSAGSGKTYTLALSFIALALKGDMHGYHDYYRRILAITFTNKAASEMKERVLEYLECLSKKKDKDSVLAWLKKDTNYDDKEIFARAGIIHKHILHNYADLGILTIDKFTYKIVRTFASDLDLSHNFDLEMDNYKIIQPVVALLLSRISDNGGDLSDALVNFAMQKAEDGKSTNIERDLEEFAKQLFKEEITQFTAGSNLSLKDCIQLKRYLLKNKKDITLRVENLAIKVCDFFNKNGLTKEHFKSGIYYNHFTNKLGHADSSKWQPTDTLLKNIEIDQWYANSKSQEIKDTVEKLKPDLIQFSNEMMDLLTEYNSVNAILKNIYSMAILNEMVQEVKLFKKENNIEQISEFNNKIYNIVTNQPSTFIYERLGERYNHYLIDEFQDTSLLQWQNILPLVTDSLDYGSSILVGDGKQSIYRWRGGEVEQFTKLPEIYNGDNLAFKIDWEKKLKNHYSIEQLKANYRSRQNIIEFNNQFFKNTKAFLSNNLKKIYDNSEQEVNQAKSGGYVHVELFGDKNNDYKQLVLEKMISEIKKITTVNNYCYKDIAILCNSRTSVALVADCLSLSDIPVISNEGLLLNKSDKVNTLIAILKYLQNFSDNISKAVIAEYLFNCHVYEDSLHEIYLEIRSNEGFMSVLRRANIHINPSKLLQEPLYELVEQIIRVFKFNDDVYLDFFLDVVLFYSEKEGSNISAFLLWWEERVDKESIVIPEGTDAVQIMTIHKSKGLAFNIVMIPFNWEDRRRTYDIWVDTSTYFNKQLPAALVAGHKSLEYSYFKDEYLKEKEMIFLDSLNKLYVAMTRSKDRLYILSKNLPDNLPLDYEKRGYLNSFFSKGNYIQVIGDSDMLCETKKQENNSFIVSKRNKLDWRNVISLKHSAAELWDTETSNTKRDWGKLFHLVLSKIHYTAQKDQVINSMYKTGVFSSSDKNRLREAIDQLLEDKNVKYFFSNDWDVKTEREILIANGKTYIPDRLLFSKTTDEVIVIDYKTGVINDTHENQIIEYSAALEEMGWKNVNRVLIYTSDEIKVKYL